MILLNDVVDVSVLSHQDVNTGFSLDALNGGHVGAALVNGDLLWHVVQVDGTFQKSPGRGYISLGSEEKIYRIAVTINSAIEVLPLA